MNNSHGHDVVGAGETRPLVNETPKPRDKDTHLLMDTKHPHDVDNRFRQDTDSDLNNRPIAVNGAINQHVDDGLDDVDGAMFSRSKVEGQGSTNTSMFDDPDGAMFSRSPNGVNRRNRPDNKLRITKSMFGSHVQNTEIPRSPSDDCLNFVRFSKLSANFPVSFTSAGNLSQYDYKPSDLIDYGSVVIPDNFDSVSTHAITNSLERNGDAASANGHDDESDSALFNRGNSFKNKEDINKSREKGHETKHADLETLHIKDVRKSKSMPNITFHDTPVIPSGEDTTSTNVIKSNKSSFSLPDHLDEITDLDGNEKDPLLKRHIEEHGPAEHVITKEKFVPLTGNLQKGRFNDVISERQGDDGGREHLLEPSGSTGCKNRPFRVKYLGAVMFPAISVILFLADIGTDINLANRYRQEGDTLFFIVTVLCIVVPSLLMTVVDLSWIYIDRNTGNDHHEDRNSCFNTQTWKVVRVVLGLLSCGRVVRTISHIYHSIRSQMFDDDRHKIRKIEERRDYSMLDVINAFTESCPQLIAQMVLLYKYRKPFNADLGVSIVLSWFSIGWAYSCYYRYHKESLRGRNEIKFYGIIVFNLAVLSALATRICCISLFLVYYPFWIGAITLIAHLTLMWIWIKFFQKPDLEGLTSSWAGRNLYFLFFAYLSIMYFVNLKDTPTRVRLWIFFVVYYVENIAAAGLLLWKTSFEYGASVNEFRWSLLIVPLGTLMHICLLTLFYKCFHPGAKKSQENTVPV